MPDTVNIIDLDIDQKELVKKLTKLTGDITELKDETKKLEKENKALEAAGKKNTVQYEENSKQIETNKAKTKGLSTEYRNNQNVLTSLTSSENRQLGTLQKLELSNKKLREESKRLDLSRKDGQKRLTQINKQLDKNNAEILKNADATKKQKMNIGAYGSQLGALGGPMAGATRGVGMLNMAFKALIANPIGLILAAIAIAIKAIADAVSKNQGALDRFKAIGDGISASYNVLLDRINAVGRAIKALGKLNFKTIKEGFKGIGAEMVEEFKAAKQLREELQALEDQEIDDIGRKAELRQAIELKRLASKDDQITEQERLKFDEAIKLEEELLNIELETARERARISQEQIDLGESTRKELEENARLQANLIDVETASIKRRRTLAAERLSIARKVAKEELSVVKKLVDDTLKEFERIESPFVRSLESDEAEMERFLQSNNDMIDSLVESWDWAEQQKTDILDKEIKKRNQAEIETFNYAKLVNEAKLDLAQDYLKGIAQLFGAQTAIGKAAAVAETAINTYRGAQAAYASLAGIPVIGPVLGGAAAGAAVLMGLANVKKILAVKSGLPGDTGGGGGMASVSTGRQFTGGPLVPSGTRPADGGLTYKSIIDSTASAVKQGVKEAMIESPAEKILVVEDVTIKQLEKDSVSKVTTV